MEEKYYKSPIENLLEKYQEKLEKLEIKLLPNDLFYVKNKDCYPPFKNGLYMEEYFLNFMKMNHLTYDKNGRFYLPILWTNFQIEEWFSSNKNHMQLILDEYVQQNPNEKNLKSIP